MGASLGAGGGPVADMNLTPLIDIVLVVLIIMMVNIPIQIDEMGIKVPDPDPPEQPPPPPDEVEQLVIALYENGDIALNRKLMKEDVLFYEVTRRLRPMSPKRVFIDAHGVVPYGRVVDMVDLSREAGAATVGLARLKEAGPLPATSVAVGALPRGVIKGSVNCVGKLEEAVADPVIDPLMGGMTACYNTALVTQPELSGNLTIRAVLGPQGEHMEPPRVQAGPDLSDQALIDCVAALLPALTYPPLGEGNTAVCLHPILFSPG